MNKKRKLRLWTMAIFFSTVLAIAVTSGSIESTAQSAAAGIVQERQIASEELKDNDLATIEVLFRFDHPGKDSLLKYNHFLARIGPVEQVGAGADGMESWRYVRMSKKLPGGFKINAGLGKGRFGSTLVKSETLFHTIILVETDDSPSTTLMLEYQF